MSYLYLGLSSLTQVTLPGKYSCHFWFGYLLADMGWLQHKLLGCDEAHTEIV